MEILTISVILFLHFSISYLQYKPSNPYKAECEWNICDLFCPHGDLLLLPSAVMYGTTWKLESVIVYLSYYYVQYMKYPQDYLKVLFLPHTDIHAGLYIYVSTNQIFRRMYVCTYIHTYIHTYTHTHTYMYVYIHIKH